MVTRSSDLQCGKKQNCTTPKGTFQSRRRDGGNEQGTARLLALQHLFSGRRPLGIHRAAVGFRQDGEPPGYAPFIAGQMHNKLATEFSAANCWMRCPLAIYTTDAARRLTYYNAAAVQLAGRTPEIGTGPGR